MTVSIVVICEGPVDQWTGCGLADRVICSHAEWITDDVMGHYRSWRGLTPGAEFCLWKHVGDLARERRIRAYGHFADEPAEPDALVARRALLLIATLDEAPGAVILLRDDDGQEERRNGLEQARNERRKIVPVVVGLARTKRECWVLAGFVPHDNDERRKLDELRQGLGFDPTLHAERLDARMPNAKRNAVRVLARLTSGDPTRESACWLATDLATLAERGANSGLKVYLDEVEKQIVPLFAPAPR